MILPLLWKNTLTFVYFHETFPDTSTSPYENSLRNFFKFFRIVLFDVSFVTPPIVRVCRGSFRILSTMRLGETLSLSTNKYIAYLLIGSQGLGTREQGVVFSTVTLFSPVYRRHPRHLMGLRLPG